MNEIVSEDTETRILKAAEQEFMTKGFTGARTTVIAQKAGVTHAMFHYYFRTKEKIYERIITEKMMMIKNIILESIEEDGLTLEEIVRNIIDKHLEFISANPDLPHFTIGEIYNNPDRTGDIIASIRLLAPPIIKRLQKKIDETADEGKCRRISAQSLFIDILSLNLFPYMASPVINAVFNNCMEDSQEFLETRKKDNFETIMRKLKL